MEVCKFQWWFEFFPVCDLLDGFGSFVSDGQGRISRAKDVKEVCSVFCRGVVCVLFAFSEYVGAKEVMFPRESSLEPSVEVAVDGHELGLRMRGQSRVNGCPESVANWVVFVSLVWCVSSV